ncbi:MAG: iron ABC transporter permease [Clostridia bacterium]|nr:iron ABC transporter permease [Clostridia bacterium]
MNRKIIIRTVLVILNVILILLSLASGGAFFSLSPFFRMILGQQISLADRTILLSVRLPRVIGSILAGIGLSTSGVLLKILVNNDLAGPNIIGINSGAGLGVIISLIFFQATDILLAPFAFLGSLVAVVFVLSLSMRIAEGKHGIILVGIAFSTFTQALISVLYTLNSDILSDYLAFSVGNISGVQLKQLIIPGLLILFCFTASVLISRDLDKYTLGDMLASSLGLNVKRFRILIAVLACISSGSVVSYAGLIGFVGLVVPLIAAKLTGSGSGNSIVTSALLSSLFVMLSDLLSRVLFLPGELPTGMIIALIASPVFFVFLLQRRNSNA